MATLKEIFDKAAEQHKAGHTKEAEELYKEVLSFNKNHSDALHMLGHIKMAQENYSSAVKFIHRAICIDPNNDVYIFDYGRLHNMMDEVDKAIIYIKKAISLKPAIDYFNVLAQLYINKKDFEAAIRLLEDITQRSVNDPESFRILGSAYRGNEDYHKALTCVEKSISLDNQNYLTFNDLGNTYLYLEEYDLAVDAFKTCLTLKPDFEHGYNSVGLAFKYAGRFEEGNKYIGKLFNDNPQLRSKIVGMKGGFLNSLGMGAEMDAINKGLENDPDDLYTMTLLIHKLDESCDYTALKTAKPKYIDLCMKAVEEGKEALITPFMSLYAGIDNHKIQALSKNYCDFSLRAQYSIRDKLGFVFNREPKEKLKIGYISPNFKNHPTAHNITNMLCLHDKEQFEIHALSIGGRGDISGYRDIIMKNVHHFHDIEDMNDEECAREIYDHNIDIMINLMGHTENARSGICCLKPTPIQIHMQSYPGTMGAEFIDYFVADRMVTPLEHRQDYTEKIIEMPDCYFVPNSSHKAASRVPSKQECNLPEDKFIYSSFNRPYKNNEDTFRCWMKILERVDNSVLWLGMTNEAAKDSYSNIAQEYNIAQDRLIYADFVTKEAHLARHIHIDLALDSFAYGAHTTAFDVLSMNLPIVTYLGETHATRACASMLNTCGLNNLIANSHQEYIDIAVRCANDTNFYNSLIQQLVNNRETNPLFDTPKYVRNFELALKEAWRKFENNEAASDITVSELAKVTA